MLMKRVGFSASEELLLSTPELPPGLPSLVLDNKVYSSASGSLSDLQADPRSLALLPPYSPTPNSLPRQSAADSDTVMPKFPTASLSVPFPEACDAEPQEITRSKSFPPARGSSPSSESFSPGYLLRRSKPRGDPRLRMHSPASPVLDDCVAVEQVRNMSSFQADYWACAIPDTLPPSPDRRSPYWNPNKEYEDLLDYTYPLKPKHKLVRNPKYGVPDPFFHDSGVDLDSFSVSPESTLKSISAQGQEQHAAGNQIQAYVIPARAFSTPVSRKPGCSVSVPHCEPSPIYKVAFAECASTSSKMDTLAQSLSPPRCTGLNPYDSSGIDGRGVCSSGDDPVLKRKGASVFIRTTQILPLRKEWASDEEFLSLPPRLKELEGLAQQLTDLSLAARKPEYDPVRQDLPCLGGSREQFSSDSFGDHGGADGRYDVEGTLDYCVRCQTHNSQEQYRKDGHLSCQDHKDSLRRMQKPASTTRDVLDGRYLGSLETEGHHVTQETDQRRESLVHCIKKFKQDLAGHQMLTESVLKKGETLLRCMEANSPVLKHTLGSIAKQSNELESHAERLYESVLTALDTVGGDRLAKEEDTQQAITQAKKI
uniref:Uncharacterized protein n=1 Tax=Sphenodon punctatus TaxID=8508 RepID=A0A8D0L8J1_SPHPU